MTRILFATGIAFAMALASNVASGQQRPLADVAPEPLVLPPAQRDTRDSSGITSPGRLGTTDTRSTSERINRINRMLGRLRTEISKQRQPQPKTQAPFSREVIATAPPGGAFEASPPMPAPPQETKAVSIQPLELETVQRPVSLTSTVDSLALANSLFAQGKVSDAKPIYEKLAEQTRPSSELIWIQYQLACCYRTDGQVKEAIRLYRLVAAAAQEPYWAGRAQWWLKYLGKAQALETRRQELDEIVAATRKELDALQDKE